MSGAADDRQRGGGGGGGRGGGGGPPGAGGGGAPPSSSPDGERKPKRGIQWDEPTIAEHDKERGSRKKIAEPKTPYRPPRGLSSAGSVGSVASDDSMAATPPEGLLALDDPRVHAALAGHWDSGSESESHGAWREGRAGGSGMRSARTRRRPGARQNSRAG